MTNLHTRQTELVRINLELLRQGERLLLTLDQQQFTASPPGLSPHRASGHLRHIIEFYECLLAGLADGRIDYDNRRRDGLLENSRDGALRRLSGLAARIASDQRLQRDSVILLHREDSQATHPDEPLLTSSIGRELQFLSSHTVHHFALIGMTLRALGVTVPADFGVAPSTLRHAAHRSTALVDAA